MERKEETRSKCKHLTPVGQDLGLFELANDVGLTTIGERAENKASSDETYKLWFADSKKPLDGLYKCALTGDYCVARKEGFFSADLPQADYHEVCAEIDIQRRCPSFENVEIREV